MTSPAPETTFHGVCFDPRDRTSRLFGREELEAVLADDPVFCWIDLQGPNIEALNELLRIRHIDLKLASHFDAPEILPRIVERPGRFLCSRPLRFSGAIGMGARTGELAAIDNQILIPYRPILEPAFQHFANARGVARLR